MIRSNEPIKTHHFHRSLHDTVVKTKESTETASSSHSLSQLSLTLTGLARLSPASHWSLISSWTNKEKSSRLRNQLIKTKVMFLLPELDKNAVLGEYMGFGGAIMLYFHT